MKEWYVLQNTTGAMEGRTISKKDAGEWLIKDLCNKVMIINDSTTKIVTDPGYFIPDVPERNYAAKIETVDLMHCPWCKDKSPRRPDLRDGDIIFCDYCRAEFLITGFDKNKGKPSFHVCAKLIKRGRRSFLKC